LLTVEDEASTALGASTQAGDKVRVDMPFAAPTAGTPIGDGLPGAPNQRSFDNLRKIVLDGRAFGHLLTIDVSMGLKRAENRVVLQNA
jgi:hypothetical protein